MSNLFFFLYTFGHWKCDNVLFSKKILLSEIKFQLKVEYIQSEINLGSNSDYIIVYTGDIGRWFNAAEILHTS